MTTSGEPTRSLAPEIVREVFLYALGAQDSNPLEVQLDLLAGSLVCRTWYDEACRLIDNAIFRSLFEGREYKCNDILRFAKLLAESRRLGLYYYYELIETMNINVACLDIDESDRAGYAFEKILRLWPPNLIELTFDMQGLADGTEESRRRFNRLLERLAPLCDTISRVYFHADGNACHASINSFITITARRLLSLRIDALRFEQSTHDALRICTALREIHINQTMSDCLATVISSWPDLRRFRYDMGMYDNFDVDACILALARSCPRLGSFELVTNNGFWRTSPENATLEFLVAECPYLRRFGITGDKVMNDEFLARVLLRQGRELEHITLDGCVNITGDPRVTRREWGKGWPELKSLSLRDCEGLSVEFAEMVLDRCGKLKEVVFPEQLIAKDIELLEMYGFSYDGDDTWRRE
ncbi:hypothetical protein BC938DRAFT_472435 [Jimgerdemannia flammicorona]|uniref:F-box domain-containing protein n=1 Tax=Jimgerdemannia flammicorona TaxID=994334 RepID=A0A433Q642_9FUNG|nr:hypothetical protein BC938DRAFT_472435 [Jimgerdemannia flammicorona]